MNRYTNKTRVLVAVDCIIFGFDGNQLKLLLVKRNIEPEKGKWSLIGGFVLPHEDCELAATRTLKDYTGLEGVYLEQLNTFSKPERDPIERTVSVAYFALIDIKQYQQQLSNEFHPEWYSLTQLPVLIFDHAEMVALAKERLKYKAALHPILFELLPQKFTLPQLQCLYEGIYGVNIDKRNFSRKIISTGLLLKQKDKEKQSSKKGAFYYKLDKKRYSNNLGAFLNIMPNAVAHIKQ
jgi:ADP-ribose pyrophosphatase YjhB (NUDIX family)